ncbi:MAG: SPFH domain-containing protein [Candidatus Gracilibacteria bacterium]|jgi:regulator of protease activity HflC (stomatin/prohibitin superfamily)
MPAAIVTVAFVVLIILLISIRQVNEYQRGVKFSLGKYSGTVLPGWRIIVPVFQSLVRVDMRIKAVDVPNQETITKDNISVGINAVIYYKIADSAKAILQVENFFYATSQLAQTTMRNVVGSVTLDHLLQNREELSATIQTIIDQATEAWGIDVQGVELKDIMIPDDMKRTMAKAAEAERERRAVIIQAEGEVAAAENISKAAKMLAAAPGALHLRTLQSINDISSDASNTTIWMIPVETLKALEGFAKK